MNVLKILRSSAAGERGPAMSKTTVLVPEERTDKSVQRIGIVWYVFMGVHPVSVCNFVCHNNINIPNNNIPNQLCTYANLWKI
mmetsp:Transcript_122068/g.211831  ORF Transcript_122068/g.211831 Transcript_122068/m.211831 type:complete len:83 (-) Transcript_122068:395-643(-)